MILNRIAGSILVFIGIVGFLTVADDLRHIGEFVGVSSVFLSGAVLVLGGFQLAPFSVLFTRSIAAGMLVGITLGVALDHMPMGGGIGLAGGVGVGLTLARLRQPQKDNAP